MVRRAAIIAVLASVALAGAAAAGAARPSADLALALRFRPRLLFDARERWRPLDVDRFLAEPGHQACSAAGICTPFTSVAQLTPAVAYLDLRGSNPEGDDARAPGLASCPKTFPDLFECDADGSSKLYAHVVRTRSRIAIDYWWFLRYNAFSLDEHEGDWEGVVAILDAAGRRLLAVDFAAHASVWRYDPDVPQAVNGRVAVYVARGDHASYPRACFHVCKQTGDPLPEGRFDGKRPWFGNSAAGCRRRCVALLPADAAGAPAAWDGWDGRWGAPYAPAFPPPLTPSLQNRFRHPFAARRSHRHQFRIA